MPHEIHYRVQIENPGCPHCLKGRMWDIVDPDGDATGTTYGDEDEANDVCDDMNMAFNRGKESK